MSLAQETADAVYHESQEGDVPLASVVARFRNSWGEQGVKSVHHMAREVATCLLHREDIQVGDVKESHYVPWEIEPWDADQKISSELMSMDRFLDDERRYVFRRKP